MEITYGEPITVRTAKGVVRAKYLLIAGNAYLPQNLDSRVTSKSMPCGSQIVVTEPLAEAEALLTAARLVCYRTLWLRDQGMPHTSEAAMCKWWAPKTAFQTIHRCLLTHGHSGYTMDLPHQQRLRDVMGLQIGDGTEQVQKMISARETIGRVAVPY